jgi:hypothetical protein
VRKPRHEPRHSLEVIGDCLIDDVFGPHRYDRLDQSALQAANIC